MDEGFVWLCTTSVLSRFNRPGLVFVLPVTNLWLLPLRRRITFEENVLHRNQATLMNWSQYLRIMPSRM
jgi:hypothetical protein